MDVIEKLNKLRLEKNMSVYRLSELSGINQSTLANTFSRKTVPSIKNLEAMCEALGLTLSQFFEENETFTILSVEEAEMIKNYRKINKELKETINKLMAEIPLNNYDK